MESRAALSPGTSRQIRLRDGRVLGYAEYGDPGDRPLVFFHGWPSSRLFLRLKAGIVDAPGVRIIAPERPGFGLSDFKPGSTVLDWADDVVELANGLKIDRFAVAGHSGGGPYALACAFKIASRLTGVGIVSGFAPLEIPGAARKMMPSNRLTFGLARHAPRLHELLLRLMISGGSKPFWRGMARSFPDVDRAVVASFDASVDDVGEAFRGGVRGPAWDQRILARPWGFRLQDIAIDVHLWHGDRDVMVPVQMGRYLATAIPSCHATICPGEGHLLIFTRWPEILATLLERSGETEPCSEPQTHPPGSSNPPFAG